MMSKTWKFEWPMEPPEVGLNTRKPREKIKLGVGKHSHARLLCEPRIASLCVSVISPDTTFHQHAKASRQAICVAPLLPRCAALTTDVRQCDALTDVCRSTRQASGLQAGETAV